jgi:hypothetical protein
MKWNNEQVTTKTFYRNLILLNDLRDSLIYLMNIG